MTIDDWIYATFGDVLPYGNGSDLRVNCPFCAPDENYHLHISLVKQTCHCFRCDYSNTWLGLVADVEDVTIRQAQQLLMLDSTYIPLYVLRRRHAHREDLERMPEEFYTINQALQEGGLVKRIGDAAAHYVRYRLQRFVRDYQHYYDVWGVWGNASGWGKLVLPVERGWWQVRPITQAHIGSRYVSCTYPKEDRLYNHQALNAYQEVHIAEGVLSAACIGMNAVGLCGKHATPQQLKRLIDAKPTRYVVCLDPDAFDNAVDLADDLSGGGKTVVLRKYLDGDPADTKRYVDVKTFQAGQRYINRIGIKLAM